MKTSQCYLSHIAVFFFCYGQQKENTDYAEFDYDSENLRVISKLLPIFLLI